MFLLNLRATSRVWYYPELYKKPNWTLLRSQAAPAEALREVKLERLGSQTSTTKLRAELEPQVPFRASVVLGDGVSNVTAMYINGVLRSEVDLTLMRPYGLAQPCSYCMRGALSLVSVARDLMLAQDRASVAAQAGAKGEEELSVLGDEHICGDEPCEHEQLAPRLE